MKIGIELEYSATNIAKKINEGGTTGVIGIDGYETIELRLKPIPARKPRLASTYITSIIQEMLRLQKIGDSDLCSGPCCRPLNKSKVNGGCGMGTPVGMHIHFDKLNLNTRDPADKVCSHMFPLWLFLSSMCGLDSISERLSGGYGEAGAYRNKRHLLEYRGLPTPPTPGLLGFVFRWAAKVYNKRLPRSLPSCISKIRRGMPKLETISIEKEWSKRKNCSNNFLKGYGQCVA